MEWGKITNPVFCESNSLIPRNELTFTKNRTGQNLRLKRMGLEASGLSGLRPASGTLEGASCAVDEPVRGNELVQVKFPSLQHGKNKKTNPMGWLFYF
jgi:hypothetical protein